MEQGPIKILIIDDEAGHIHWMRMLYKRLGLIVFDALSLTEARDMLKKEKPHILTIESYMQNSHWFLQEARKSDKEIVRVVLTATQDAEYFEFLKNLGLAEYCLSKSDIGAGFERLEGIITEIASLIRV
jgi:DNA-binding NarL/FixJ family response regulator